MKSAALGDRLPRIHRWIHSEQVTDAFSFGHSPNTRLLADADRIDYKIGRGPVARSGGCLSWRGRRRASGSFPVALICSPSQTSHGHPEAEEKVVAG